MYEIDKNSKAKLSEQISNILIHDIRTGLLKPGTKLEGYRRLAKRFEVSWGTVIEALDYLEKKNYIERISGRGTFVSDDVNHELKIIKIVFLSPKSSIALNSYKDPEEWRAVSETYRGVVAETINRNAEIFHIHFDIAENEIQLSRQLRRLEDFDAIIFMTSIFNNLCDKCISIGKPCMLIASADIVRENNLTASAIYSAFKKLARYVANKKYKRLHILNCSYAADSFFEQNKIQLAIKAFNEMNINANKDSVFTLKECTMDCLADILSNDNIDLKNGTDIIYCAGANIVPLLYRYCSDNNIIFKKNLGAFGYADGIMFNNLEPIFTYSQINHFEKGRQACESVIESFHSGQLNCENKKIDNILILGGSL